MVCNHGNENRIWCVHIVLIIIYHNSNDNQIWCANMCVNMGEYMVYGFNVGYHYYIVLRSIIYGPPSSCITTALEKTKADKLQLPPDERLHSAQSACHGAPPPPSSASWTWLHRPTCFASVSLLKDLIPLRRVRLAVAASRTMSITARM